MRSTMDSVNEFSLVLLEHRRDAGEILDTVKRMLMSRNLDLQMKAVLHIIRSLSLCNSIEDGSNFNKESLPDFLLNSDLTEFLCEAMSTVHCHLIDEILKCLEMLSNSSKFYRNSHVVFVTECLVRTIHFLVRQDASCCTLNRALKLLAILLRGYDGVQIGALNVSPVLDMVKTVLGEKVGIEGETALHVSAVLNSVMENHHVASQFDIRLLEWLSVILEGSMSQLSRFAAPNKQDAVLLMIGISASTSRLCSSLWFVDVETAVMDKYMRKIARILLDCIQNVCVPYILEVYIEEPNMDFFFKFFTSLKVIYEEQMKSLDIMQLSYNLGEHGFLTLIPVISTWSSRRDCNRLHYVCMSVLGELLVSMSETVLGTGQLWPGGTKAFREHLHVGLWHLPSDYTYWLNLLGATHATEPSQHTVIVLSFFSCACASSPSVTAPFLPAIVAYLTSLHTASMVPTPITKALWFVFAASSLSHRGPIDVGHATNVLLHLLELQTDLRNVYIHHPALLHWAFSTPFITSTLQGLLMNLWLEIEDNDSMLMDLMTVNRDAEFCLIDVVQCSTAEVGQRALKVLESLLSQQLQNGREDLLYTLWEVLPHILARLSASYPHIQNAGNVAGLLQLVSMSVPQQISTTAVVRAAYLLTRVLVNKADTSLQFYRCALYQAALLLLVSMELQDKRVLGIFMSEPQFLEMLQTALNPEYPEVCSSALYLFFLLLYYQMQLPFLECEYTVVMDSSKVLELMMSGDVNVQSVCLQLMCHLLLSRLQRPVIRLIGSSSSDFMRSFFIQLQILCTKKVYEVSSRSWKCMGVLLQTCEDPTLKMHLASQPWTGFIVSVTVQNITAPCVHNFLYFVNQWLQALQAFNPLSKCRYARISYKKERALAPHFLCEPLSKLASMVLNDMDLTAVSPARKELNLQIMNGILGSGVELVGELENRLRCQVQLSQTP